MTWTHRVRVSAFERIPQRWRPAAAYHYYRMRSLLERELPVVCQQLHPGLCAVDVGANEGVYTHAFARTGAHVEAFEPQPQCAAVLVAYARRNTNVRVHTEALGARDGWDTLSIPLHDGRPVSGHATLAPVDGAREHHTVQVRPLDSFELTDVALMKIDVEGRELDVLKGARRTISQWRPTLLVEIEQRHGTQPVEQVFAEILALGYAGTFLHPERGRLPLKEFDAVTHQNAAAADTPRALYINNFIFTPIDHPRAVALQ